MFAVKTIGKLQERVFNKYFRWKYCKEQEHLILKIRLRINNSRAQYDTLRSFT